MRHAPGWRRHALPHREPRNFRQQASDPTSPVHELLVIEVHVVITRGPPGLANDPLNASP